MTLKSLKKELRFSIKAQTLALSAEQKASQSASVEAQLRALLAAKKPSVVALFMPLADEVQIGRLADELAADGAIRVVVPRIEVDSRQESQMEFYTYHKESMQSGSYGIDEPEPSELCVPELIDLMVVPGVAFTRRGERMGRGKGFYDRYLAREGFSGECVGVCYSHQVVDALPLEPHDRVMDMVVTPEIR